MNSAFADELARKEGALIAMCERYGVRSLAIFGSGIRKDWNVQTSDLDFVVRFAREDEPGIADRYLGLAEGLEALFERPVDLVPEDSIRNPYFRQSVEATRTQLYAA
jgi:predicted nucleotidyltransferase